MEPAWTKPSQVAADSTTAVFWAGCKESLTTHKEHVFSFVLYINKDYKSSRTLQVQDSKDLRHNCKEIACMYRCTPYSITEENCKHKMC
jgi:hypothetical protein